MAKYYSTISVQKYPSEVCPDIKPQIKCGFNTILSQYIVVHLDFKLCNLELKLKPWTYHTTDKAESYTKWGKESPDKGTSMNSMGLCAEH